MLFSQIGKWDILLIQGMDYWLDSQYPLVCCALTATGDFRKISIVNCGLMLGLDERKDFLHDLEPREELSIVAVKCFPNKETRDAFIEVNSESIDYGISWDWEMRNDNRYRNYWDKLFPYWDKEWVKKWRDIDEA